MAVQKHQKQVSTFKDYDIQYNEIGGGIYHVDILKDNKSIVQFDMLNEIRIVTTGKKIINQIIKFKNVDGISDRAVKMKIKEFVNNLLKEEKLKPRTSKQVTKEEHIKVGAAIIPRDVDIVAKEDIAIVARVNNGKVVCLILDDNAAFNFTVKTFTTKEILDGYLTISDAFFEEAAGYIKLHDQMITIGNNIVSKFKSIVEDINKTAEDNNIDDYIVNSILNSDYNGLVKERMLEKWENLK